MAYNSTCKKNAGKDIGNLGKAGARRILDKIEKDLTACANQYPVFKGQFAGPRKLRVGVGVGHENRITINRDLRLKNGWDWTKTNEIICKL